MTSNLQSYFFPMEHQSIIENAVPTDTLKLLYLMTFGVMRLRFVKFILISIFIFHSSIGVAQVIDLLSTFDGRQLLQYGPFFLCLVNVSTVLSTQGSLSKLFIRLAISRFRTLERLPLSITKKILLESKMVTFAEIATLSILLLYSMSHVRLFHDENFLFAVVLFRRSFSKMADFFCLMYFSTLPILAYVAFINGGVIIYTLMHLRFYMFLINCNLEQISEDYDPVVDIPSQLRDDKYQEEVFEQLKNCIERHQMIKLIEKKLNVKLLPSLVLLLYLGVAAFISMLLNVLTDDSRFGLFLAMCSMIASTITPVLVVHIGQIVKNEYDKMYENTLQFPWLVWNTKNRKVLVFFMLNLQKSFYLGQPGFVLCQYSFLPIVLNFLWTVSTFIVQVAS